MLLLRHSAVALVIVGIFSGMAQAAVIQTYTDRAAFLAALPHVMTEDFDQFFAENGETTIPANVSTQVGAFSILQSFSGGGTFAPKIVDAAGPYEINSGASSPYLQLRGTGDPQFIFSFDVPSYAFGANFNSISDAGLELTVLGEDFLLADFLQNPAPASFAVPDQRGGFFGFVSDMPFTSFVISSPSADTFAIDDTVVAAVPLPAPLALLVGAMAFMGAFARRRSA